MDPRSVTKYREQHVTDALSIPFQNVEEEHRRLSDFDLIIVNSEAEASLRAEPR